MGIVAGVFSLVTVATALVIPNMFPFLDRTGIVSTYNTHGPIKDNSAFFQSLGTNGRSCATCHVVSNAMGLSTDNIQARFFLTRGRDPLFAAVDGANCPNTSSNNPASHSLLLKNGLIRIPMQFPRSPSSPSAPWLIPTDAPSLQIPALGCRRFRCTGVPCRQPTSGS